MIAVLVPVLDRPGRVRPLMESFRTAGGPARLLFIASPEDVHEIAALKDANADFLLTDWPAGHADYARKIQMGYERTTEPWIFTGADDLQFYPGWAQAALRVAEATGKRVIGTTDLGNPEVKRGQTATHLLIARSYVEEYGTLDQRGQVFCHGYSHNWVDREAVQTAKLRNEWAFAPQSVVEHLHFHWGKGDGEDATYRKGLKEFQRDRRLYAQRMKKAGVRVR